MSKHAEEFSALTVRATEVRKELNRINKRIRDIKKEMLVEANSTEAKELVIGSQKLVVETRTVRKRKSESSKKADMIDILRRSGLTVSEDSTLVNSLMASMKGDARTEIALKKAGKPGSSKGGVEGNPFL